MCMSREWQRFFIPFQTKLRYYVKNSGLVVGPLCREQLHEALDAALDELAAARTSEQ